MDDTSTWTLTVIDSDGMEEMTIETTAGGMGEIIRVLGERGDYVSIEARQVVA